jgi:hydroxyacylglutathione hydrolase
VKEKSAQVLHQSIQQFMQLPDYLQVWPAHGAGSACGKALGAVPQSTVGYEKRFNTAIQEAKNEQLFVESILYGQPEPPLYFARMKRDNKEGPALLGEMPAPKPLTAEALKMLAKNNAMILDTRAWPQFVEGHVPGALFAPLDNSFPTVAGSYVEPGNPIYLIVEAERVQEAVTDLIRIGLDEIVGYATPQTFREYATQGGALRQTKTFDIKKLLGQRRNADELILDVRRADEFNEGHLAGARNIAHTRLLARLEEVPKDRPLLVHCRTSNRSAYATALLERHGYDVTMLHGGFAAWTGAGGEIV